MSSRLTALVFLVALGAAATGTASAEPTPAARAVAIADAAVREPKTEVLVLGTPHLSALPEGTERSMFDPLLDKLAIWQPDLIALEGLGGAQCDYLREFAFAYEGTAETYCFDAGPARKALGLDQAGAEAAIERILAEPSENRPPAERRYLAAIFLAAGDRASAMVQWLRLPEEERRADAVLTEELAKALAPRTRLNESYVIGARLAARLGLERVHLVDDHTGDRATGPDTDAFAEAMPRIWDNEWAKANRRRGDEWIARLSDAPSPDAVIDTYIAYNSPEAAELAIRGDFGAAAADTGAARVGRRYLAYWETRNLRMVANIREAAGPRPGIRVLAIVGASHKPYYERYLGMLSEMRLADVAEVLR